MPEMISITQEEKERLEARAKKSALEKSYLQLIIRLMNNVSATSGLENLINNLLRGVADVIGGLNIMLYYRIDNQLHYTDVYGKKEQLERVADPLVQQVFDNRTTLELEHEFSDTKMATAEFGRAYTWVVPLSVGPELVGVLKLESLNIAMRELYQQLPVFFNYAALVLKNELQNYALLKSSFEQLQLVNRQLSDEILQRERAEELLLRANEELEKRVVERTAELYEANQQLQEELGERKRAELEILHLKNYLSNIIDSMPSLLVGVDPDEQVVLWNHQAESITGIAAADAVGRSINEMLPEFSPWIETLRTSIQKRQPSGMEKLLLEHNGVRSFYDLMLYPLVANGIEGAVIRIEDVTERTRVQSLMVQTEKMMSVGGLAAGMAHEINNPLGIIIQAAHNIERRVDPAFPPNQAVAQQTGCSLAAMQAYFEQRQIPQFIASICESSARAAKIIRNILDFSKNADTSMVLVPLSEVLEQTIELAGSDYDLKKRYDFRSIEIVREYDPSLPPVKGILVELEQVFLNLLKNAAQAMMANPDEQHPRIVLRLYRQGEYAVAEVEDNGPGMPEEVRRRVFEPFFTTKEPGIGTGLGLSVSYMIVTQNHKGLLEAVSSPDRGACFSVKLPLPREEQYA